MSSVINNPQTLSHKFISGLIPKASEICQELGFELVELKTGNSNLNMTLELTIMSKSGNVGFVECELVALKFGAALDEMDNDLIFKNRYLLEVQSPGIDRKLKSEHEFKIFSGKSVKVKTNTKLASLGDTFIGVLTDFNNGQLTIKQAQALPLNFKASKAFNKANKDKVVLDCVQILITNLIEVRLFDGLNDISLIPPSRKLKQL